MFVKALLIQQIVSTFNMLDITSEFRIVSMFVIFYILEIFLI
jgi:hypothetical protein